MADKYRFFNRNDCLLIASILFFSLIFVFVYYRMSSPGKTVIVYVDGEKIAGFSLDEDTEYEIEGYDGGRNVLVISDGYAFMKEASCPDRLCMNQGRISRNGQMIVCLPNRVVLKILGGEEDDYDAVTG